jgi:hypothetical protein
MSSLYVKFDITNKQEASFTLGALIVLMSLYLNISTRNSANIVSIPLTCLVVLLSIMLGAIQVSVQNITYNTCVCKENDIYDDMDNEVDDEADEDDDEDDKTSNQPDNESNNAVTEETNNQCDCNHSQWICTSCTGSFPPTDSVSNIFGQVAPSRSLEQLREFAAEINENNRKKRARWEMDLSGTDKIVFNPEEYLVTPLSVDTGESSS